MLESPPASNEVTINVLLKFKRRFKFIVEEDELEHITVKQDEGEESSMTEMFETTSASRFFHLDEYRKWKICVNQLPDAKDLQKVEAEELVSKYCSNLVESIIIIKDTWFLMTSFSVFVHNNPKIDDCADQSKVGHQNEAVAFIRRKTRMGRDFFELTYGYVGT